MVGTIKFIAFDLPLKQLPIGCYSDFSPSYYVTLIVTTLGPLLIVATRGMFFLVSYRKFQQLGRVVFERSSMIGDFIFVFFLFQPTSTKNAFQTFTCTDRMDDGKRWLMVDLSLDCDSTIHAIMVAYALIMVLIWPIGVSHFFYVLLRGSVHLIKGVWDTSSFSSGSDANTAQAIAVISEHVCEYMEDQGCDMEQLFFRCDRDGDGRLSIGEFLSTLDFLGVPEVYWAEDEDLFALFHALSFDDTSNQQQQGIRLDDFMNRIRFYPDVHPRLLGLTVLISGCVR